MLILDGNESRGNMCRDALDRGSRKSFTCIECLSTYTHQAIQAHPVTADQLPIPCMHYVRFMLRVNNNRENMQMQVMKSRKTRSCIFHLDILKRNCTHIVRTSSSGALAFFDILHLLVLFVARASKTAEQ